MNEKWKGIIRTIAPKLGALLLPGGPLAGAAISAISEVILGKPDGTEDEVAKAIEAMSPADYVKLKEAEANLETAFARAGVDLERIAAGDRASARQREVALKDITPRLLAFLIVGSFVGVVYGVLFGELKVDSALAGTLVGYVSAKAEQVLAYFFGSTSGSARKTELLATKGDKS